MIKGLTKKSITEEEYQSIHSWLRYRYGKAKMCESKDCLKKSVIYDWAKLPDKKYERARDNFIQLCRQCHIKGDMPEDLPARMREIRLEQIRRGIGVGKGTNPKVRLSRLGKHLPEVSKEKLRNLGIRVEQIKDGKVVAVHRSLSDAGRSLGISTSAICQAFRQGTSMCAGYYWRKTGKRYGLDKHGKI